jgi:hypothetical protein
MMSKYNGENVTMNYIMINLVCIAYKKDLARLFSNGVPTTMESKILVTK